MKKIPADERYRKVIVRNTLYPEDESEDIQTSVGKFKVRFGEEQELNEHVITNLTLAVPIIYVQGSKERYPKKIKRPTYVLEYLGDWYTKEPKKDELKSVEDIPEEAPSAQAV